jgi:hypothetical protein
MDEILFGKMQARIEQLDKDVTELKGDMKTLLELANKSKGGIWAGMTLVGVFSSAITWIVSHLPFFKP